MKVSFIIPPPLDGHKPAERSAGCTRIVYPVPNIYELTVAALFERLDHKVEYHDFVIHKQSVRKFEKFLNQHQTDIFCIWGVSLSMQTDIKAISTIRKYHPETWVLLMGPGPTYFPSGYLTDSRVVIIRGEPETSAANLLKAIEYSQQLNSVKGISFLDDKGKIVKTQTEQLIVNLDYLPFPARHLTGDVIYSNPKLKHSPYTAVVTSRNCPYKCIYCVPSSLTFARELESKSLNGKKPAVSTRTVGNIDEELAILASQGFKSIAFLDDNFIWDVARLRGIVESLNKYDFHWGCQARADAISEDVADILATSKCDYIDLGIEAFNNDILKFIRKGMTEEHISSAIGRLTSRNIPVKLNILIGTSPLETKNTIRDSIQKAKKMSVSQVMINIVSPFPGTEYYEMAKKNGWIRGGEYRPTDVQRESIIEFPHITSKEMERLLFWSNFRFFIRPKIIYGHLKQFRSFKDFYSALKSFKIKMFG
jgi:anaerobic magnesium-protoporphyrin IX monomethyl ester cyclase